MDIQESTREYERWLAGHLSLVRADLSLKHRKMAAKDPFPFFRATFYRWAESLPRLCPNVMDAPRVLAVGDIHVENFGSWRDAEGRLAYGVNDFDEAFDLPYTTDLVRLAASAALAAPKKGPGPRKICDAIMKGYAEAIAARISGAAGPTILADRNWWLSPIASTRDPEKFWRDLCALRPVRGPLPTEAAALLREALPAPDLKVRVSARAAGMGSLGRPRFCALALWNGGLIAREVKAMAPSACVWVGYKGDPAPRVRSAEASGVRARDPHFRVGQGWLARRLAPDCDKLNLDAVFELGMSRSLLTVMARETAHVHGANPDQLRRIDADLRRRGDRWLRDAVKVMLKSVLKDWDRWRKHPLP